MSFAVLAVVVGAAILGPLLAAPRRWHLPVVLGELLAGIALGRTGIGYLKADNPTFMFLAEIGFGLVMFVAGTHVPMRNPQIRPAVRTGASRAAVVAAGAVVIGVILGRAFGTGHWATYAVLLASSSAALALPIIDSLGLGGPKIIDLLPQVAIADAACIVALPLAIDTRHVGRAAVGALVVIAAAAAAYVLLRVVEHYGLRRRLHKLSEDRQFALELRIGLVILFCLAALAVRAHVSIMLAGFAFGLGVSAVGEPRRVAKQLFALTEGFLGPVFFVWLGASLQLRDLGSQPRFIVLGLLLGLGATATHLLPRLLGQPLPLSLLAAGQLGVPVAAATIGTQTGVLHPGESSALLLSALVTIAIAVVGGSLSLGAGLTAPTDAPQKAPADGGSS